MTFVSDHRCVLSLVRISCAVIRTVSPDFLHTAFQHVGHVEPLRDLRGLDSDPINSKRHTVQRLKLSARSATLRTIMNRA